MQASDIPTLISEYFAKNAGGSFIRTVPSTTTTPGAASFDQGFPSECFVDPNAGGFPPNGADFNYLYQILTRWLQWVQAGGAPAMYNSTFQTAIGGYPNGAVVGSLAFAGSYWRSIVDNNVTNPNTGGAGWVNGLPAANGQCQLQYVSGTQIKLVGWDGVNVTVGGATARLTSAVTAANTGVLVNNASGNLAASTVYYVSLYWTGSTLALAFWAIGTYSRLSDTTANNIGTQVIASGGSPITGHSLVGMIRTDGSGNFIPQISGGIISWFNQMNLTLGVSYSGLNFSNTAGLAEVSTSCRVYFLCWNTSGISGHCDGQHFNSVSGTGGSDVLTTFLDNIFAGTQGGGYVSAGPAQSSGFETSFNAFLSEGFHFATLQGVVTPGSVGTVTGTTSVLLRG